MRKIILIIGLVFIAGCGEQQNQKDSWSAISDGTWWVFKTTARGAANKQNNPYISGPVTTSGSNIGIDTYGYGVHSNRYGQPIKLIPDFGYVPGEQLHIKEDAYGHGVHSDQYGRPVREYPWP